MKLSLIIPAFNEEARLGAMLDAYLEFFLPRYGADVEWIVVVNGSRDRTDQVAQERAQRCPQVRVIVEPQPIGKGGAVMRGFAAAGGALVGFVDADCSTPPEAFQDLVEHLGAADAIIASRWLPDSHVSPRQPFKRRLASRVFNAIVRLLFRLPISDTQCGAKLMRSAAVQAILPCLGLTRWAFDVDLLFQLRRNGFRIVEWPTTWRDAEGSRIRIVKTSWEMLLAVFRLRLLFSPFRWVVSFYNHTAGRFIRLRPG